MKAADMCCLGYDCQFAVIRMWLTDFGGWVSACLAALCGVAAGFQHLHAKHSRRHTHAHRPDLDDLSSSSSTGDDSGCGGAGAGSSIPLDAARQQDLQRPLSISTSCSLRCSLDTAASSDMRLRNTLAAAGCGSATTSCQQQLQWQLQQQQQLQRLEEGQEVPADAQAVFCDEPGSEKGRAAADAAWVSKDVEAGQGRTAGGSTGIRNRGGARRAQRDDRQGGRVTAGLDGDEGFAGATFRETAQEVGQHKRGSKRVRAVVRLVGVLLHCTDHGGTASNLNRPIK